MTKTYCDVCGEEITHHDEIFDNWDGNYGFLLHFFAANKMRDICDACHIAAESIPIESWQTIISAEIINKKPYSTTT